MESGGQCGQAEPAVDLIRRVLRPAQVWFQAARRIEEALCTWRLFAVRLLRLRKLAVYCVRAVNCRHHFTPPSLLPITEAAAQPAGRIRLQPAEGSGSASLATGAAKPAAEDRVRCLLLAVVLLHRHCRFESLA